MSKILALDISSKTIGWAFMELTEDDLIKATVIEYGHIKPKKGTDHEKTLANVGVCSQ